jgi:hypothetical protein
MLGKKWLVFLLVCALLCVPARAFSDDGAIGGNYRDAVTAMAERGVLEGFEDGSFQPGGTLTREQGAKIITYLCIGKAAAQALRCTSAPFDDVEADRWSAPCIAWCVARHILHGYGDGTYGPTDKLTGDQYAKMLLCALGLARPGNYADTGADWYKAVREDARAAKLYAGDAAMERDRPVTRQQAALPSWHAAQAGEAGVQAPAPSGGGSGGSAAPAPTPAPLSGEDMLPEMPVD